MKAWEEKMEKNHPVLLELLKGVMGIAFCGLTILAAVMAVYH